LPWPARSPERGSRHVLGNPIDLGAGHHHVHLTVVVMLGGLGYLPMLALGLIAEPLLL